MPPSSTGTYGLSGHMDIIWLDTRAAREGRSRSELIREALTGYLATDAEAAIDREIVEAYTRQPQTADELAFAELGTRTMLANVESWGPPRPKAER
jgi:Arc/MetJ-type ribon-helix-helix transcriptional regulator